MKKLFGLFLALVSLNFVCCNFSKMPKDFDNQFNNFTKKSTDIKDTIMSIDSNGRATIAVSRLGIVLVSYDSGNTWTQKDYDIDYNDIDNKLYGVELNSIACNNNKWIACGRRGMILVSIDNGATWIQKKINASYYCWYITYIDRKWVLLETGGKILISDDNGETFRELQTSTDKNLRSIASNGNRWIAVGDYKTIIASDDYGETWHNLNTTEDVFLSDIVCNGTTWCIVGSFGSILTSINNGTTWTKKPFKAHNTFNAVVYFEKTFVIAGDGILTSKNNTNTFELIYTGQNSDEEFNDIVYTGNNWITVGKNGTIVVSTKPVNTWK